MVKAFTLTLGVIFITVTLLNITIKDINLILTKLPIK